MLVLSRQARETIVVGDDIEITILHIRGAKVRLGITAPPEVRVHRKEVWELIQGEKRVGHRRSGGPLLRHVLVQARLD